MSTLSLMVTVLVVLLGIAIVGVVVGLIIQAPMPPVFRNVIIGVAVLLVLVALLMWAANGFPPVELQGVAPIAR